MGLDWTQTGVRAAAKCQEQVWMVEVTGAEDPIHWSEGVTESDEKILQCLQVHTQTQTLYWHYEVHM